LEILKKESIKDIQPKTQEIENLKSIIEDLQQQNAIVVQDYEQQTRVLEEKTSAIEDLSKLP
jgi:hypothetical protein